jgi:endonuclease G
MLTFRRFTSVVAMAMGLSAVGGVHAFDWKGTMLQKVESVVQSRTGNTTDSSFAQCTEQFPQQKALNPAGVSAAYKARALCFDSFATLYSGLTKTPIMSIEKLNAERLRDAKGEKRTDRFYEEARLPSAMRATLNDYRGSGMDRGHMAPAADMPNPTAMAQSFSLANMVPQNPINNQKIWSKLESDVRKYAMRAPGNTFVYTGPLFSHGGQKTQGVGKVWIPDQLFKLVYNEQNQRAFAYIIDNSSTSMIEAPMEYAEFVLRTKLDPLQGLPIAVATKK